MGRGGPGDSHTTINEWGGTGVVPGQVKAAPELKNG
jgi:hypothetical protein